MSKTTTIFLYIIFFQILFSCVYDPPKQKIATIKNNSDTDIVYMFGYDTVTDENLFYLSDNIVKAKSIQEIYSFKPLLGSDKKIHLLFFNSDTITNFIRINKMNGIFKHSFLKEIKISPDSLKKIDTIVYK